jgi:hypothetical protein
MYLLMFVSVRRWFHRTYAVLVVIISGRGAARPLVTSPTVAARLNVVAPWADILPTAPLEISKLATWARPRVAHHLRGVPLNGAERLVILT